MKQLTRALSMKSQASEHGTDIHNKIEYTAEQSTDDEVRLTVYVQDTNVLEQRRKYR